MVQGTKVWLFMKTCITHLQDTSFLQNIPLNCAGVITSKHWAWLDAEKDVDFSSCTLQEYKPATHGVSSMAK
jgi:hypothetical protein